MNRPILAVVLVACCVTSPQLPSAAGTNNEQRKDESPRPIASKADTAPAQPTTAEHDEIFQKLVTNVRLSGHFTIVGEGLEKLRREEYVITGATKLGRAISGPSRRRSSTATLTSRYQYPFRCGGLAILRSSHWTA